MCTLCTHPCDFSMTLLKQCSKSDTDESIAKQTKKKNNYHSFTSIPTHCVRTSESECASVGSNTSLQPRHVEKNSRTSIIVPPQSTTARTNLILSCGTPLICLRCSPWLGSFAWPTYTIYVAFVSLRMVAVKEHISVARVRVRGRVMHYLSASK